MTYLCSLTINLTDFVFFKNIFHSCKLWVKLKHIFTERSLNWGVCRGQLIISALNTELKGQTYKQNQNQWKTPKNSSSETANRQISLHLKHKTLWKSYLEPLQPLRLVIKERLGKQRGEEEEMRGLSCEGERNISSCTQKHETSRFTVTHTHTNEVVWNWRFNLLWNKLVFILDKMILNSDALSCY